MSDNNTETNTTETTEISKADYLEALAEKSMQDEGLSMSGPKMDDIKPEDMFTPEVDALELLKQKAREEKAQKEAEPELEAKPVEKEETKEDGTPQGNEDEQTDKEETEAEKEVVETKPSEDDSVDAIDLEKTYKIKVDGKLVEITGAELQSKASGELAVEKRFAEVDKVKKEWQAERDADQADLLAKKEQILSGDLYGALSEMFDIPAYTLKENLLQSLSPEVLRRSQMTEEQKAAERVLEERKYYKDSYEAELNKRAEEQKKSAQAAEQNALNQEIAEAKAKNNISDDQWDAAFKHLDKTLPADVKIIEVDMVVKQALEASETSTDDNTDNSVNFEAMADKALEPYKKHINDDFRKQLLDFIEITPDLSEDQLNEIVKASVTKGLKQKLIGNETNSNKKLSKSEKLKKLQETALESAIDKKPDENRNWF